jgi:hypothetical protein
VIFSLSEKLWTEKYPFSRFNHLSTTYASIGPSNNGISKITCTLKGPMHGLLDEDASPRRPAVEGSACKVVHHFVPLSCRDSSRNILIGYPAPSYLFFSHGFFRAWCDQYGNGSIGSSPNFLYPNLVGDMHEEK